MPVEEDVNDKSDKGVEVPKNGNSENIPWRIAGLEQAKKYPEMTPADIAALDRMINKLKEKLAEKTKPKQEEV